MIFPGSLPHLSADYHGQAAACGSVPAAASMLADLNSASLAMAQSGYTAAGHHHHPMTAATAAFGSHGFAGMYGWY